MYQEEVIINNLRKIYLNYGFDVYRVPKYCDYHMYFDNDSFINEHEVIKIIHPSGKILALQPDITISCAHDYLSNRLSGNKFFYIGNVYHRSLKVNQDISKIKQVGIEIFDLDDLNTDIEVLLLALQSLDLVSDSYRLDLSEVNFINGLLEEYHLSSKTLAKVNYLISRRNTSELEFLLKEEQLNKDQINELITLVKLYGPIEEVLAKAQTFIKNEAMQDSLDYLQELYKILNEIYPNTKVALDFTLRNSKDYYSGLIFQGFIKNINQPVISGGRYHKLDHLLKAVGYCFNLELVIKTLSKPPLNRQTIVLYGDNYLEAYNYAKHLRANENVLLVKEDMIKQYNLNQFNKIIKKGEY
ncbi:MAG: ATP phosphoribosyltransferase regulatory subunit [Bacilli bacterium]